MTRIAPVLALALTAAACQPAAEPESEPVSGATSAAIDDASPQPAPTADEGSAQAMADDEDACGATKVRSYIGEEATVPVRIAVAREAGSSTDRWIYPDSMVTEDFSPTRLNVTMEKETDRIVSMRCG